MRQCALSRPTSNCSLFAARKAHAVLLHAWRNASPPAPGWRPGLQPARPSAPCLTRPLRCNAAPLPGRGGPSAMDPKRRRLESAGSPVHSLIEGANSGSGEVLAAHTSGDVFKVPGGLICVDHYIKTALDYTGEVGECGTARHWLGRHHADAAEWDAGSGCAAPAWQTGMRAAAGHQLGVASSTNQAVQDTLLAR